MLRPLVGYKLGGHKRLRTLVSEASFGWRSSSFWLSLHNLLICSTSAAAMVPLTQCVSFNLKKVDRNHSYRVSVKAVTRKD
jgi:hypothetical protein